MKNGIVILAAGESSRMGRPKQLLLFRGTTLLQRAIDTALAVAPVAVVLGAHREEIRAHIADGRVMVAENPDWSAGMGGSIRAGLSALLADRPELDAAIFQTCDQPFLTAGKLSELIETRAATGADVVACEYGGTLGVPALFGRALFPELLALDGAAGAKQIIVAHRHEVIGVPFPEGAMDIDTPADFERLVE